MIIKPADRTGNVQEYYFSQKLAQIDKMRKEGLDVITLALEVPINRHLKIPLRLLSLKLKNRLRMVTRVIMAVPHLEKHLQNGTENILMLY